jgi:hypothetical protein
VLHDKGAVVVIAIVAIMIVIGMALRTWRGARADKLAVTSGETYRDLADEYRKLAEMAITAQEHADLKLADVGTQLSLLREELRSVQRILEDVD